MISKIYSITVNGLNSDIIEAEIDINNWMPAFKIVGLPDQSVQESKERIRSALKNSGKKLPTIRIIVNLAPADIKKTGPSFDFPIAIGILLNSGEIEEKLTDKSIFIWELSLNWDLRKVNSILPATIKAKEKGFKRIFVPYDNSPEASIIPWIEIIRVKNLSEVIKMLNWEIPLDITPELDFGEFSQKANKFSENTKYDFKYVIGQTHAKRALEIAAAWGHNIIMEWPPWSGKTMLSKSFAGILPELSIEEAIWISKIYSISGLLTHDNPIITKRPFRTVHHTASAISIIWGWTHAKPGEISLAHKWVLFLDEILEFEKSVLEVLRQPLEDWTITVNRVNATYTYPANFILVWAMNPCPCGFLTDTDKECICSVRQISNYRSRLSWPLIDRIDIFIEVPKVKTEDFKTWEDYSWRETSAEIKTRVEKARILQLKRFENSKKTFNAEMQTKEINKFCILDEESEKVLKQAVASMNLSARSYYRILKLSRTIADLEGKEKIETKHILEALSFRKKEEEH